MSKSEERLKKKIDKARDKAEGNSPFTEKLIRFKNFCVKDTSRMILLVTVLIVIYLLINYALLNKNLAQIDLTTGKLHTLTDRSKQVAKSIDKDITFYLWNITEDSGVPDLLRQLNKENSRITFKEVLPVDKDIISKFGFEEGYSSIVAESSNNKRAYINSGDLFTYDDSFNIIDLTEQKLTNSLLYLNNDKQCKVYVLQGKTAYNIEKGLVLMKEYLEYDNYAVDSINLGATGKIPDDCDVLVIWGLTEDLTLVESNMIIDFIAKGGDLIIGNDVDFNNGSRTLPNFDKVLKEYALGLPNNIIIQETSDEKIINQAYGGLSFKGTVVGDHEITRVLKNANKGPILSAVGPVELDYTEAYSNNVTPLQIVCSSEKSVASDLSTQTKSNTPASYTIVAAVTKTAESGQESRAVVFGTAECFSDISFVDLDTGVAYPFLQNDANLTILMNSFAYVTNQGELYSIRKASSETLFSATVDQTKKVLAILIALPTIVAVVGVIVCAKRRKLK